MADVWRTKRWDHRVYAELLGMIMVNTFLAWNTLVCPKMGYAPFDDYFSFKRELAKQLIQWTDPAAGGRKRTHDTAMGTSAENHKIVSVDPNNSAQQIYCSYCKNKRTAKMCATCSSPNALVGVCINNADCLSKHFMGGVQPKLRATPKAML